MSFNVPVAAGGSEDRSSAFSAAPIQTTRAREAALARLLMAYISSGLVFMLLPGTFLGVWNLLQISGRESVASVSPAWLQAHGHAQVFGWIGSFIFGIGFYSIPKLRGTAKPAVGAAWACWAMWTAGVAMRWCANIYGWEWRVVLPISSVLELAAFLIFFRTVARHRPRSSGNGRIEPWTWVVISASIGLMLALVANAAACIYLALRGTSPALPHTLDQRYLALLTWGFLVPFVWGFSTKWMPVFLGLRAARPRLLLGALAVNFAGVALTLAGWGRMATIFFVAGTCLAIAALGMFERAVREAKTRGVHGSFPFFIRMAYGWLLVAASLGAGAAIWDSSGGIWGASRHALTVGFIAVMVMCVGQRVLPAFAGMRLLWSSRLMFAGLALLTMGCCLRVPGEILAYQGYANWAWAVLPISAMLELAGITAFAMNIFGTFILEPSHVQKSPIVVGIARASEENSVV
ncbi:MAG: NnrS family protein [Candidatus Acidiferrales bacterium]